jgi:hypothetical protein
MQVLCIYLIKNDYDIFQILSTCTMYDIWKEIKNKKIAPQSGADETGLRCETLSICQLVSTFRWSELSSY